MNLSVNKKLLNLNLFVVFLICLVYLFYSLGIWKNLNAIEGDGRDYYSYLVSLFIDKNLGHQDTNPGYVIATPTGTINVHTAGLALLWFPFFVLALLFSGIFHYPADGFSFPFQIAIQSAAVIFLLTGLHYFQKTLSFVTQNTKQVVLSSLIILCGTNLLYYTVNAPSLSHVYSFALISIFIYLLHKVFVQKQYSSIYWLAFILGLNVLIRPFNILILLLLPLWSNNFSEFFAELKNILKEKRRIVISTFIFLAVISIQSIIWYFQNGKLFQDSYKGNGFYFSEPHVFSFLFGFTSGFFIYTPLCLIIMLVGLFKLYREKRFAAIMISIFFVTIIYLLSCYSIYNYTDTHGMRVMVDYYILLGILSIYAFRALQKPVWKYAIGGLATLSVCFNLLLHYQTLNGIINPGNMNYDKFKYVFLRTGDEYKNIFGGCNDLPPYVGKKPGKPLFEKQLSNFEFGPEIDFGINWVFQKPDISANKLFVEFEIQRTEKEKNSSQGALIGCAIDDSLSHNKYWKAVKLNETPSDGDNNSRSYSYSAIIDQKMNHGDKLIFFIWNQQHQKFTLNNLQIKVYDYSFET